MQYDSGDYPACQAQVLQAARLGRLPATAGRGAPARAATSASGSRTASRAPAAARSNPALVRVSNDRPVSVLTGAAAIGQGLGTALAQICAGELGLRAAGHHGRPRRHQRRVARPRRLRQPADRHRRLLRAARRARGRGQGEEAREPRAGSGRARSRDLPTARCASSARRSLRSSSANCRASCKGAPGYGFPPGVDPGLEANVELREPTRSPTPMPAMSPRSRSISRPAECKILRYVALQDSGSADQSR